MKKNILLLWTVLLIAQHLGAQNPTKRIYITDSGQLMSTYTFSEADMAVLEKQFGKVQAGEIVHFANETNWPESIGTLENRITNKSLISKYTVFETAELESATVLIVPKAYNAAMPAAMQSDYDFYFVFGKKGLADTPGTTPVAEPAQSDPEDYMDDEDRPYERVYVTDPGKLLSTFDLLNNEAAKSLLTEYISQEDFENLARLSHEDHWPAGISTLTARLGENKEKIKNYFMYFGASFVSGEQTYILAWVPYEENQFMPKDMQPGDEGGFYMIFLEAGVRIE